MFKHNFPNSNHNNTFLRYDKASVKQKGTENRLPRGWRKIFNACKCNFLIVLTSFCASSLSFLLAASDMMGACRSCKVNIKIFIVQYTCACVFITSHAFYVGDRLTLKCIDEDKNDT